MAEKQFKTFEEAWQTLFEALPPHERLEILSNPKGPRAALHAKEALLASEDSSQASLDEFMNRRSGGKGQTRSE
jgi:hypothetical protein